MTLVIKEAALTTARRRSAQGEPGFSLRSFPKLGIRSRPSLVMGLAGTPAALAVSHVITDTLTTILDPDAHSAFHLQYLFNEQQETFNTIIK